MVKFMETEWCLPGAGEQREWGATVQWAQFQFCKMQEFWFWSWMVEMVAQQCEYTVTGLYT